MVALVFDATAFPPAPEIAITLGRNRSELRWSDQRRLTFDALADMLRHSPVGTKDGPCFTPAIFSGTARRKEQAVHIDLAVLDADCGHTLGEIETALRRCGWRAIVHSTFSHMTEQTVISAAAYDQWLTDNPAGTPAGYMASKKGYLPAIVAAAQIIDELRDGTSRNYLIKHAPCPKYRVILPLQDPWQAHDYPSQQLANAAWRERIGALASALQLHHDQSCVDTSRLFYFPRRRDGAAYDFLVVQGEDCPLWTIPEAAPVQADAPLLARAGRPQEVRADHKTFRANDGQWIDLTSWAAAYASRFEVVDALRARAPHVFGSRRSGVKWHIECPNAGGHITGGADRTGTFAVNASLVEHAGLPEIKSGFALVCMHNGCAGLDRLDHVRKLLCDGALSIADLTDPAFLTPKLPRVDPSALIKSAATKRLGASPAENAGNIAPALYADLPGALGIMHEWICATAPKPQPALALGAAMAFSAAAIGQRVQMQRWGTRPNIYVLAIAHSGAGKDRPLTACKQMARAAGMFSELIGVEEVASDAGIVSSVIRAPRQVILIDEISFLLQAASNRNAGPHLTNVIGTLLKLYSSSSTTYQSKSYADTDKVKTIDQPCASLYGNSTPAGLTSALTSKDITSGLLSRMVLFDAGDSDPRVTPPSPDPAPPAVVDWLKAWKRVSPIQSHLHREGGEQLLEPRAVLVTQEAVDIATAFEGEMHAAKLAARKNGTDALFVRALENALKFAMIRACAILPAKTDAGPVIDESALRVDATTMRWAVDLSRATVERMVAAAGEIADSPYQQALKELRKVIRRGGEQGAAPREIAKLSAGRHPKKMMDDLFNSIAEAGEAFWVEKIKTNGRPRSAWVHRDFIAVHRAGATVDDED